MCSCLGPAASTAYVCDARLWSVWCSCVCSLVFFQLSVRWREVQSAQASELWVGALLESVEVDDWGKYKFLLLRIRDRAGRQKLLVRGANYASDAKLVEGLHRQVGETIVSG